MIRTGYSFRAAVGHLPDVVRRLQAAGWPAAPIADRVSTFGHVRWEKLAKKAGLRPVFGVELGVTAALGEKKQTLDYWTFFAKEDTRALNEAVYLATSNPGREPSLTYKQALSLPGVIRISGERVQLSHVPLNSADFYVGLSPATPRGLYKAAQDYQLAAVPSNFYPEEADKEFYRVALGRNASNQSYPQHILSDDEWRAATSWFVSPEHQAAALRRRDAILAECHAGLPRASLLRPDHEFSLREMCEQGARRLGVDLMSAEYAGRLDRELRLIAEKGFEDYFFIIADMMEWARRRMVVGPARGSSGGSLVCYLTGITSIDPVRYGLLFERFIDTSRSDLPDIDLDFSDQRRHLVFEYAEQKYGLEHVARLGTVGMFKDRASLNQVAAALRIPRWQTEKVADAAAGSLQETLEGTPNGRALLEEHSAARLALRLLNHPSNASQHAAGIVLTDAPLTNFVAIDARTKSAMCDKKDAEELNLLKIDALGLTQLSIFERTLQLIGKPDISGFLESLPLDDPAAFRILNDQQYSGIFQFMGGALRGLARMVKIESLQDMVALTALARPGPMDSGGAAAWVRRKSGREYVTYAHPIFEPLLRDTLGVVVYQEQVMQVGREVGGLSWEEVTALRRIMGKSLGAEAFDQFGAKWKAGAQERGVPADVAERVWDDLCANGNYAFNKSHAVAYAIVSYWCCWLKAHHPVEFAAATLDAESDPARQIAILRELNDEGVKYVAVDAERSTERWVPAERDGVRVLVGPLTNVKGLGPASVREILSARDKGDELRPALSKRLAIAKTEIDTLFPVGDRVRKLHPDLGAVNIFTEPTPIIRAQCGVQGEIVIIGVLQRMTPKDENAPEAVAKRGRQLSGPTQSLNMFFADDTDEIFVKVDRFSYERMAKGIIERGRVGRAIYAIKGSIPVDFRMIKIKAVRYLGDMEDDGAAVDAGRNQAA